MTDSLDKTCGKCGAVNPGTNEYCRRCGAIIGVTTAMIRAQKKPFMPRIQGVRWRWVGLGALVLLGANALAAGAAAGLFFAFFGPAAGVDAGLLGRFAGLMAALGVAGLAAFAAGGAFMGFLSRQPGAAEPALAACLVIGLLAVVGSALTSDAILVAGLALLPCAAAAGLGGRMASFFGEGEE